MKAMRAKSPRMKVVRTGRPVPEHHAGLVQTPPGYGPHLEEGSRVASGLDVAYDRLGRYGLGPDSRV